MPDTNQPPVQAANTASWDPELIFPTLGDPVRRRLLFALARGGAHPASVLKIEAHRRLDATLKHLVAMRRAGLLVVKPDPVDGRRMLYSLAPSMPLTKTEGWTVIDFGFCLLRF